MEPILKDVTVVSQMNRYKHRRTTHDFHELIDGYEHAADGSRSIPVEQRSTGHPANTRTTIDFVSVSTYSEM